MKWRGQSQTNKEDLNTLRKRAIKTITDWGITDDDALFELDLILCELIANGAEHGNKGVQDKKIKLNMRFLPRKNLLLIFMQDEGLDKIHFQKNTEICNKNLSTRGRGLLLLNSMVTSCHLGAGRVWIRKEVSYEQNNFSGR